MRYYPLFMDLTNAHCLILGAGTVGRRKLAMLIKCFASSVSVLDPAFDGEVFEKRCKEDGFELPSGLSFEQRAFNESDLHKCMLVFACTNDMDLNERIARICADNNILCNTATVPNKLNKPNKQGELSEQGGQGELSTPNNSTVPNKQNTPNKPSESEKGSFLVPSYIQKGPLTIAISSSGASPAFTKILRQDLEKMLDGQYIPFLEFMEYIRPHIKGLALGSDENAKILCVLVTNPIKDKIMQCLEQKNTKALQSVIQDVFSSFSLDINCFDSIDFEELIRE